MIAHCNNPDSVITTSEFFLMIGVVFLLGFVVVTAVLCKVLAEDGDSKIGLFLGVLGVTVRLSPFILIGAFFLTTISTALSSQGC